MKFILSKILSLLMTALFIMSLTNIICAQIVKIPKDWKIIDLPLFSFFAPSDFISEPFKGKDSTVWKYKNQDLELTIDLGLYSAQPIEDEGEDNYTEKSVVIDRKKATIVSFKFSDSDFNNFKYVTAAYFPRISSDEAKLSFVIRSKNTKQQRIAEKIFRSIRFKKEKK